MSGASDSAGEIWKPWRGWKLEPATCVLRTAVQIFTGGRVKPRWFRALANQSNIAKPLNAEAFRRLFGFGATTEIRLSRVTSSTFSPLGRSSSMAARAQLPFSTLPWNTGSTYAWSNDTVQGSVAGLTPPSSARVAWVCDQDLFPSRPAVRQRRPGVCRVGQVHLEALPRLLPAQRAGRRHCRTAAPGAVFAAHWRRPYQGTPAEVESRQ
jgi:hypothetical protein